MKLIVAAAGKLKGGPEAALCADYAERARRLGRGLGFSAIDLKEIEAPRGLDGAARQAAEAERLLASAPPGAALIALDERGRDLSSAALADDLARKRDDGVAAATFLIGGADGHAPIVRERAGATVSFGKATWPHLLVRVMVVEQIYRAMTILAGTPYHRA
ncbi:MAG: 23S rRNA (pseudouridine(1915)-N(3))-methyltransferase RlmH [Pseudomonadota bacterium]